MVQEQQRLSPAERANLVAYLDGELNEAEARAISTKLTQSITARRELEALELTWELLELLPRPQLSTEFTSKTLTTVKGEADREGRFFSVAGQTAQHLVRVLVLVLSSVFTLAAAYAATRWLWPDPTARLERELSLAEHLDEYRDVGSFEFLKLLDDSPEFKDELSLLQSVESDDTSGEPESRLRAMPREQRLVLAQNLERFDLLSPSEQAAVRELDDQLASLPAADRTRLQSLLHRYHLWMLGLSQAKREELAAASGEARLAIVGRYRSQTSALRGGRSEFFAVQLALAGPLSLFDTAHLIKIWLDLKPEERMRFERNRPTEPLKELRKLGRLMGIDADKGPTIAELERSLKHGKSFPKIRNQFEKFKDQKKEVQAQRLMEALYLLDHQPAPVDPQRLYQFDSALPSWFRDQLDSLPVEAARWRLTVLYRLVYPEGQEMPDPAPKSEPPKAAPAAPGSQPAAPRQAPRPQSPAGSGAVPF
jgi:Protein of unknown function (DUF3106)